MCEGVCEGVCVYMCEGVCEGVHEGNRKISLLYRISRCPHLGVAARCVTEAFSTTCVRVCVYVHVYMCVCRHVYVHVCMYVYMCVQKHYDAA